MATVAHSELPPPFCPISDPRGSLESQVSVCAFDEDGNGFDDEVEEQLAACFVPEFRFDSAENALRPTEPHLIFSAYPVSKSRLRIRYVALFERDGGHVLGTQLPCLVDSHEGDTEDVTVEATWERHEGRVYGSALQLSTTLRAGAEEVTLLQYQPSDRVVFSGTHPILFATAGKHHWSQEPVDLRYACSCGALGMCGQVRDRADGAGRAIVPERVDHAPGFYLQPGESQTDLSVWFGRRVGFAFTGPLIVQSLAPLGIDRRRFWNACELAHGGRLVPAHSLRTNDLSDLGYAGEEILGPCFRGGLGGRCGETISVAQALSSETLLVRSSNKLLGWLFGPPYE